jgi:hypothetical protein
MKWQKLLTKKQLAHMRWARNGNAPTLWAFKMLRRGQRKLEKKFTTAEHSHYACFECDEIERQLKDRL